MSLPPCGLTPCSFSEPSALQMLASSLPPAVAAPVPPLAMAAAPPAPTAPADGAAANVLDGAAAVPAGGGGDGWSNSPVSVTCLGSEASAVGIAAVATGNVPSTWPPLSCSTVGVGHSAGDKGLGCRYLCTKRHMSATKTHGSPRAFYYCQDTQSGIHASQKYLH